MKRQRNEETEARKGKNLCFWNIYLIYFNLSYSLICRFQAMPNTWMGCVWKVGDKRERNVEGIRCYGVTICRPRQHLFRSKFIAEISVPGVTVFSGGAFSNFSKNRRKDHFQIHFMKPTSVWYQSQIRTPWEKKITG